MKKILYTLTIGIATLGSSSIQAQDRNVFWVHGMEGSNLSWQQNYNYMTSKYRITNMVASYSSTNGAASGANQLKNQIAQLGNQAASNPQNFAICHSMGGIVTRQAEKDDKQSNINRINGIITVATPHLGAQLANSEQQGLIKPFLNNGLNDILSGPYTAAIPIPIISNYATTKLADWITEAMYSKFKTFGQSGALADLTAYNNTVSDLNAYNCTKPHIALAGSEDAPILWRQLTSIALNAPSTLNRGTINDNTIPNVVTGAIAVYEGLYWTNRALSWVPKPKPVNKIFINKANAWLRGKAWMERANGMWCSLAGAVQSSSTVSYPFITNACFLGTCVGKVESQSFQINTPAPYDGIVRASSATAYPGALFTNTVQGVNHQECVNHPSMNTQLETIISSPNFVSNNFFFTPTR